MAKKSVINKFNEALGDLVDAAPESDNEPMTSGEIATARAKKKTKGASNKRATNKTAKKAGKKARKVAPKRTAKKVAKKKKAKRSKRS